MTRKLDKAVEERIQKATNTWKHVGRKIFRKRAFCRKIRIAIWYSLIRITMIYGLRARDLPQRLMGQWSLHVQTNMNDDQPELEDRSMVPREKPTLSRTTTIDDEITARQNANNGNAGKDARRGKNTHIIAVWTSKTRNTPTKN